MSMAIRFGDPEIRQFKIPPRTVLSANKVFYNSGTETFYRLDAPIDLETNPWQVSIFTYNKTIPATFQSSRARSVTRPVGTVNLFA